ncbi:hypothetical protein NPX13_g7795 [Xylaria arbuscula]|uniref:Uncharacterized protein n=1 Tax=Xylaria arbuscula TaxID=114810 RepID=A0A9W8N9Z9_9PEZI|nr:hypothetical protein NPX13_g7795 [Xylaria arbuscula]
MKRTQTPASSGRVPKRLCPEHRNEAGIPGFPPQVSQYLPQDVLPMAHGLQAYNNSHPLWDSSCLEFSQQVPPHDYNQVWFTPTGDAPFSTPFSTPMSSPSPQAMVYNNSFMPPLASQNPANGAAGHLSRYPMQQSPDSMSFANHYDTGLPIGAQKRAAHMPSVRLPHAKQSLSGSHVGVNLQTPTSTHPTAVKAPTTCPKARKPRVPRPRGSRQPTPTPVPAVNRTQTGETNVCTTAPDVTAPDVQISSPVLPLREDSLLAQAKIDDVPSVRDNDELPSLEAIQQFLEWWDEDKEREKRELEEKEQKKKEDEEQAQKAIEATMLTGYPSLSCYTNLSLEPEHSNGEEFNFVEEMGKIEDVNEIEDLKQPKCIEPLDNIEKDQGSALRARAICIGQPSPSWLRCHDHLPINGPWKVYGVSQPNNLGLEWRVGKLGSPAEEIKQGHRIEYHEIIRKKIFTGMKVQTVIEIIQELLGSVAGVNDELMVWGN